MPKFKSLAIVAGALAIGLAVGAVGHRTYELLPHNHWLKTAIRDAKGQTYGSYGDKPLTMLQTWHVQTSEALAFIDPENAKWLIPYNKNDWKKADNMNFFYIMSALRSNDTAGGKKVAVELTADCYPRLNPLELRRFNTVLQNVRVRARFPGGVPRFHSLATFAKTDFNPALKPQVNGNEVVIVMPSHPIIIDDLAANAQESESHDQRGQISHFYTLFALEMWAWSRGVDLGDPLAKDYTTAYDPNSYRNHQLINAAAATVQKVLAQRADKPAR